MRFDLLLKGGHVIDQPSGYDGELSGGETQPRRGGRL